MRYKLTLAVFIAILVSSAYASAITVNTTQKNEQNTNITTNIKNGNTLYVGGSGPGNYTKIQDAINDANNGDTIFVYNGTYYENVIINKSIDLIGEDKNNTIIDGMRKYNTLSIHVDFVNVSGFTIQNAYEERDIKRDGIRLYSNYTIVKNNIITKNQIGVGIGYFPCTDYIYHNNKIIDNLFLSNENTYQDDIVLFDSHDNTICNNNFSAADMSWVIFLDHSSNNLICENRFSGHYDTAIYISGAGNNNISRNYFFGNYSKTIQLDGSNNNHISYNSIKKGGILIFDSDHNEIYYNNFTKANIFIFTSCYNKIHHNNFIKCFIKATFVKSSFNRWYQNYWGRPRILPKIIFGTKGIIGLIPWVNIDLFPKIKPNAIDI